MPRKSPLSTFSTLALLASSSCLLSACAPTPTPQPSSSDSPDQGAHAGRLSAISVGTEGGLVDVPVDDELMTWLNTIDNSGEGWPPVPEPDAWHSFEMPSAEDSVVFDTGIQTTFDVLEILSYPDGLDDEGVPISTVVHPLCGPQADVSCKDLAWGTSGVQIPLDLVEAAPASTEYYAIAGVLLPTEGSHPDSFMALLRNQQVKS